MNASEMVLTDKAGNNHSFTSKGCVEVFDEFYEILESPHKYAIAWPHEEGEPNSFEDLMASSVCSINYKNGVREVEIKNDAVGQEVADKALTELNV